MFTLDIEINKTTHKKVPTSYQSNHVSKALLRNPGHMVSRGHQLKIIFAFSDQVSQIQINGRKKFSLKI